MTKNEEALKGDLFEVWSILEGMEEIDQKDLGVINSHLKALLVYRQLFCEADKFYAFEAKKQLLMAGLAYEEMFITNFHIDKEYYEGFLELIGSKLLPSGVKKDEDRSIIDFADSSVCNGGDRDIKSEKSERI